MLNMKMFEKRSKISFFAFLGLSRGPPHLARVRGPPVVRGSQVGNRCPLPMISSVVFHCLTVLNLCDLLWLYL